MGNGSGDRVLEHGGGAGSRLSHLRWAYGVSMSQCAAALSLGVRAFLEKERGRNQFTGDEILILAGLLDVAPQIVVEHLGPEHRRAPLSGGI